MERRYNIKQGNTPYVFVKKVVVYISMKKIIEKKINYSKVCKDKYNNFIKNKINSINIQNNNVNVDNVNDFYTNLSEEGKKELTVYELNVIYYLYNELFKRYINNKEVITTMIDDYVSFSRRSDALKKMYS